MSVASIVFLKKLNSLLYLITNLIKNKDETINTLTKMLKTVLFINKDGTIDEIPIDCSIARIIPFFYHLGHSDLMIDKMNIRNSPPDFKGNDVRKAFEVLNQFINGTISLKDDVFSEGSVVFSVFDYLSFRFQEIVYDMKKDGLYTDYKSKIPKYVINMAYIDFLMLLVERGYTLSKDDFDCASNCQDLKIMKWIRDKLSSGDENLEIRSEMDDKIKKLHEYQTYEFSIHD